MRKAITLAIGMFCLASAAGGSWGQAVYPSKPIRLVVPFGPGSNTDNLARRIADKAGPALGTTMVVVNKPGANGLLAAQEVTSAPKDGYTIMVSSASAHAANAYLYKNLGYDPVKDFAPISGITINPAVLVVRADLPVKDVRELVAWAKANPGKLNMGSGNTSSLAAAALLRSAGGFTGIDVPYKSPPDAVKDLVSGRIDFMSTDWSVIKGQIAAGKVRPLAVTSKTRLPGLPDLPAVTETLPGFELNGWIAAFAPAGTPPDAIAKLGKALADFIGSPDFRKYMDEEGMIGFATSPEELARFQQDQIRLWADVLSRAGVQRE